jgi:hypothetical protein
VVDGCAAGFDVPAELRDTDVFDDWADEALEDGFVVAFVLLLV